MSARCLRLWAAIFALAAALVVPPQAGAQAQPMQPQIVQRIGAQLPLQDTFIDDDGRPLRLGELFGGKPVVLVPGYYHCPNLCSTLFEGVLEALAADGLPPHSYRLVGVSIDPGEDAKVAAGKKAAYAPLLGSDADAHLLTGSAESIARLTSAAGFGYAFDAARRQYLHAAGFIVAAPDGRISRYFLGVRFDAAEVKQALNLAASGQAGTLADRLLLLCGHDGLLTGRYAAAAMTAVRLVCLAMLAFGAAWIWRLRWRSGRPA
jgi:protein SCO1